MDPASCAEGLGYNRRRRIHEDRKVSGVGLDSAFGEFGLCRIAPQQCSAGLQLLAPFALRILHPRPAPPMIHRRSSFYRSRPNPVLPKCTHISIKRAPSGQSRLLQVRSYNFLSCVRGFDQDLTFQGTRRRKYEYKPARHACVGKRSRVRRLRSPYYFFMPYPDWRLSLRNCLLLTHASPTPPCSSYITLLLPAPRPFSSIHASRYVVCVHVAKGNLARQQDHQCNERREFFCRTLRARWNKPTRFADLERGGARRPKRWLRSWPRHKIKSGRKTFGGEKEGTGE
jgi:hypothetical protein